MKEPKLIGVAWRGLLVVVLGVGAGLALAQWVFFSEDRTEEERIRDAHVLLDPPAAPKSDPATDVWSLSADEKSLVVSVGLDRAGIYSTVIRGLPAVRDCYESRAPKSHEPSGDERFEWTIGKDGTYGEGGPLNGAFDKELAGCLQKALKTWRFPTGKAGKVQLSFAVQKRR